MNVFPRTTCVGEAVDSPIFDVVVIHSVRQKLPVTLKQNKIQVGR